MHAGRTYPRLADREGLDFEQHPLWVFQSFLDADYTNIVDCVLMMVEIEDPETPLVYLNVTVKRRQGEDLLVERRYDWCPDTGCVPGKVS